MTKADAIRQVKAQFSHYGTHAIARAASKLCGKRVGIQNVYQIQHDEKVKGWRKAKSTATPLALSHAPTASQVNTNWTTDDVAMLKGIIQRNGASEVTQLVNVIAS